MDQFNVDNLFWIRQPQQFTISDQEITIMSEPHTDLWQRTYYGFQNDNAPVLQLKTEEKYFSFTVKTVFNSKQRFDQCGIVIYLDAENWLKASSEYENDQFQRLGSVVTNQGYSDWATLDISSDIDTVWYRLSRRESDYCIEYSFDGVSFKQLRICHLVKGNAEIQFGLYACSQKIVHLKLNFHLLILVLVYGKHTTNISKTQQTSYVWDQVSIA